MKALALLTLAVQILSSASYASTYITREGAEEGLERGSKESFTSPVGQIAIDLTENKGRINLNGVLVSDQYLLTSRHIRNYQIEDCFVIFNPDAGIFLETFMSPSLSSKQRLKMRSYISALDLENAQYHSFADLALIPLKHQVSVSPLPINFIAPKEWTNGFFVTYSPVRSLETENQVIAYDKRHISIIKPKEMEIEGISGKFLGKEWLLTGDKMNSQNNAFIPEENAHRLTAFSTPSDSGGAFITKRTSDQQFYLSAIHKGRVIIDNSLYTIMVPLYPYQEWIHEVIK
jgi:hypothetical protein